MTYSPCGGDGCLKALLSGYWLCRLRRCGSRGEPDRKRCQAPIKQGTFNHIASPTAFHDRPRGEIG